MLDCRLCGRNSRSIRRLVVVDCCSSPNDKPWILLRGQCTPNLLGQGCESSIGTRTEERATREIGPSLDSALIQALAAERNASKTRHMKSSNSTRFIVHIGKAHRGGMAIRIRGTTMMDGPSPGQSNYTLSTTAQGRREGVAVRRREYLLAMVVVTSLVLLAPSFFSANAQGATVNKIVLGTVSDHDGNPLAGAQVTVEIWGGYWPVQDFFRISSSTTTNALGYYEVTFSSNFWDPHNTIKVIVTYGSDQKTTKVEANADEYQEVNMSLNLTIPEFRGPLGLLAMMAGCFVPFVILLARRRE
jgi:uncharacterized RDD family membrane protein YckC